MDRVEVDWSDGAEAFRRPGEPEMVVVQSDARHANVEMSQLRVLCIGIAGAIIADALVLMYFWAI